MTPAAILAPPVVRTAAARVEVAEAVALAPDLLTRHELAHCHGRARPHQHLAGRVAAKRAVVLVLARADWGDTGEARIEVCPSAPLFPVGLALSPSHRPVCRAADGDAHLDAVLRTVRVSISHSGTVAVATALLVPEPDSDRSRTT